MRVLKIKISKLRTCFRHNFDSLGSLAPTTPKVLVWDSEIDKKYFEKVVDEAVASSSPFANARVIDVAVKSIKKGEILVCPTDTVYGLLGDATNERAVAKLFRIKKREKRKPVPIFVRDIKMAKELAEVNEEQEKFLRKVWPGRVTVVLKRKKSRVKLYGVDKKTIALRIPKYGLLLSLAKQLNRPLTGTSANISGKPASAKIKEVLKQFENQKFQPDLVIEAGNLNPSRPSMIVDLTKEKIKILRR